MNGKVFKTTDEFADHFKLSAADRGAIGSSYDACKEIMARHGYEPTGYGYAPKAGVNTDTKPELKN